jgi:polysaccharide biosynthesis transport protein
MNEDDEPQPRSLTHERQVWRTRFITRFNRHKTQLTRHWWVLVVAVAAGAVVQAAMWRFEDPQFVSCGRMIVNLKLSIPEGSLYTEELNNFLGTQAALMQSGVVINRAHARVMGSGSTPENQPVALKALILPRTTIFVLQGTGPDSRYTQEFVQSCMEEYINLKKEMRAQTSDTTLAGMTEEVVRLEKELRKCDEELVAFQSSNSVVLLQEQGNSAGNFLAGLNQRLATLKSEYALLQTLTLDQNLERQHQVSNLSPPRSEAPDWPARFESTGLTDSDYLRARQQMLLLKAEQDDLAQYLRPKHPKIIALTEEVARRERLLSIFCQQSAEQLESRKDSLKLQIRNLEQDVEEWDARTLEISRKNAEFQRLKANSQRTQALYDRLLATMQTLDVNKQISPESVTIMESASQGVANRPGLPQKLVVGSLVGLGAGLLLLMLLDRLDDRINSFSELQELFNEEVLGQIPLEKSALRKGEPGLLQPQDDRYAFVEAYRGLRSSLLYMAEPAQRPRTLLVTSSVPNDGKSLTSANLAITLAGAGARVLLVDADLRKGSLHNRFGLASGVPGLSEALGKELEPQPGKDALPRVPDLKPLETDGSCRSEAKADSSRRSEAKVDASHTSPPDWPQSVQATKVPNLFLLSRGNTTHSSSELFLSPLTIRFLKHASEAYDFVILDSAPVMAADDVTSLAPHIDGVIFVVRAEHTSARVARAALDLLYLRHVRVLGLVFNAVRPTSADYYYYYKYKDYHHSYPAA